jgi:transposase
MVYRHISQDLKERALWLLQERYIDHDIAHLLGVSTRSIQRWEDNFNDYGSVVAPFSAVAKGRPSRLNQEATGDLISLSLESPELFLDEIQDWLAVVHSTAISLSQLHCILNDCGLSFKLMRRAAAERDEPGRQKWREAYQAQYASSQLLFVDESSKDDRTIYRHYGRAPSGHRAVIPANFVRGERYSLVAALGVDGYEAIRVVPGSVDGETFFDFIMEDVVRRRVLLFRSIHLRSQTVLKQLPRMNQFPGERSVLVLDNCSIHKSDAIREIIEGWGT